MKIIFTPQEIRNILHTALCNGLSQLACCDVEILSMNKRYGQAKERLKTKPEWQDKPICYEDVLMEILENGEPLVFNNQGEKESFDLATATERIHKAKDGDMQMLLNIHNEEYDAIDACGVLEICLYGEIIYG